MNDFQVRTTEMGIPLEGKAKVDKDRGLLIVELDAPFSGLPAAQRLQGAYKSLTPCMDDMAATHLLQTIFRAIIHIHQNPKPAGHALREFQERKAALDEQRDSLRHQKQQIIKKMKADKQDDHEKHRQLSRIANEKGKLKHALKKLAPECFEKVFSKTIDAQYCKNFDGYIAGPGQCPGQRDEALRHAQLIGEREADLLKSFAKGWDLLLRHLKLNRSITMKDLGRELELSGPELQEFVYKVAWICHETRLPPLEVVVVPGDGEEDKDIHEQILKQQWVYPRYLRLHDIIIIFQSMPNPFLHPKSRPGIIIHYAANP